mmetsp:Transcript_20377/g.51958  ORF Transcript_20377/g.51958 Transcript_20377/m.51958 type:complete len:576 (+) Transcript_20377:43-1770(+)
MAAMAGRWRRSYGLAALLLFAVYASSDAGAHDMAAHSDVEASQAMANHTRAEENGEGHSEGHGEGHGEAHVEAEAHGEAHGDHGEAHGEAHGGGHSTGEHHGHNGHPKPSVQGVTVSVMLLGFVGFIMALYYLVNWFDEDIRLYTWKMISATLSIFLAVLSFSAFEKAIHYYLDERFTQILVNVDGCIGHLLVGLLLFLLLGGLAQVILHITRTDLPSLVAHGSIWGHICGFAAIHAFFALESSSPFNESWMNMAMIIPIFLIVSFILVVAGKKLRSRVAEMDGVDDDTEERWYHHCEECENDTICLALSFLMCAVIRYMISGSMPSSHGSLGGRTRKEGLEMLGVGFGFALLTVLSTAVVRQVTKTYGEEAKNKQRMALILQNFSAMGMSWQLYFGGQWLFYYYLPHVGPVSGKLIEALIFSLICMACILILDYVHDHAAEVNANALDARGILDAHMKAMHALIQAGGVFVGISWESSFVSSLSTIAEYTTYPATTSNIIAACLVIVVYPAWRLYILPHADEHVKERYGGKKPPISALFSGWKPHLDDYKSKMQKLRANIPSHGQGQSYAPMGA